MDRKQLEEILAGEGFPPDSYVLHGSDRDGTLNLEQRGAEYLVYYTERGYKSEEHAFTTEAAACDYFLERMRLFHPRSANRN
jgi:hypothetical protein